MKKITKTFLRPIRYSLGPLPPNSNPKSPRLLNGHLDSALLHMALRGAEAKFHDYDAAITACVERRSLRHGQRAHAHMIKARYRPSAYLATRLAILYAKCRDMGGARNVFDEMPERSIVAWTAVISGYAQMGSHGEALELFVRMLATGNVSILPQFRNSYQKRLKLGQVHSIAIKTNFESHIFVGSSLLDMYAKSNNILEARKVFDFLPERDVVSCTAILSGYAQLGFDEEALQLFIELYKEGMHCNYVTFTSLLTALSGLSALDYGKQVHSFTYRHELPFYVVLENSLIDMYSKCGSLTYARRVFNKMPERSSVSWNTMIVGYGKHGLGDEVIQLFNLMLREVKPDRVTFMAVLSGCSHGGLVDEGLSIFDYMIKEKGLKPEIGHYGCVVDLLGRAGRIEKALDFIKNMPFEPTAAMWGSLLGACRVHINIPAGEFVAKRLLDIEPENAGNYVILSNIYASASRWQDVVDVRKLMMEKAVIKEPGRSWINLDKVIHTFYSSDRFHPKKGEIEAKIKEIYAKIKEAGFVPDLSCVLHDVDDEQKERMLLGHSEKLAITFGLMGTPRSFMLRITKNLRVCVDCHNFAKFVSMVYEREISLRDSNRFHLFVKGACSCGDY
ncbi:putative pentatricopeptide repeat-containing protein, mitochondrial, partial [Ananas comosus]